MEDFHPPAKVVSLVEAHGHTFQEGRTEAACYGVAVLIGGAEASGERFIFTATEHFVPRWLDIGVPLRFKIAFARFEIAIGGA